MNVTKISGKRNRKNKINVINEDLKKYSKVISYFLYKLES